MAMPTSFRGTQAFVEVNTLDKYLPDAPRADLNVFGLPPKNRVKFIRRMLQKTNASCIFVRDSGHESALA